MAKKKIKDKDIKKAEEPKVISKKPTPKPDVVNKDILDFVDLEEHRKKTGEYHPQDPRNIDSSDLGKPFYEEGDKTANDKLEALKDLAKKRNKFVGEKIAIAKGGSIPQQMELFQKGGLKEEGGTTDEESGNEVPIGSTKEEVRDDIPAKLSEGEFVFPADVVRYIGLEKLMMLRQEAKAGLKKMEEMGQMGNADEATLPDDIPFTIDDLNTEDEKTPENFSVGGVVDNTNTTLKKEEENKGTPFPKTTSKITDTTQMENAQPKLSKRQAQVPVRSKETTTYSSLPQTASFLKRKTEPTTTTAPTNISDVTPSNIGSRFSSFLTPTSQRDRMVQNQQDYDNIIQGDDSGQDGPGAVKSAAVNFTGALGLDIDAFRDAYREQTKEQIHIMKTINPFQNPLAAFVSGLTSTTELVDIPFLRDPETNNFTRAELAKVKTKAFHDVARDIQRTHNYFNIPITKWKPEHVRDLGVRGQVGMNMAEYAWRELNGFPVEIKDEEEKGIFDKVKGIFTKDKKQPTMRVNFPQMKKFNELVTKLAKENIAKKEKEKQEAAKKDMGLENMTSSQYLASLGFDLNAQDSVMANGGFKGIGYNSNGTSYSINNNGTFTHSDGTTVNFTDKDGNPGNAPKSKNTESIQPKKSTPTPDYNPNVSSATSSDDDSGLNDSSSDFSQDNQGSMGGWT